MGSLEDRCLDAFPEWLRTLSEDARALASVLDADGVPDPARRCVASALNYLFKSLDLIPDGIEDLGFVDDAFVFRVAASLAGDGIGADASGTLRRLADDAGLVEEFLGAEYVRLVTYVKGLATGSARGRSVDDIVSDETVRGELTRDTTGWAASYAAPAFGRDEKNLVKLKSFLTAKLPEKAPA